LDEGSLEQQEQQEQRQGNQGSISHDSSPFRFLLEEVLHPNHHWPQLLALDSHDRPQERIPGPQESQDRHCREYRSGVRYDYVTVDLKPVGTIDQSCFVQLFWDLLEKL